MARIETMSYDFPGMRKDGSIYVDKTQVMYDLIVSAPTVGLYFVSRPRRFGKSLMISTLDSIFRGRKELFEGLAIAQTDYDWAVHPILRFDFSRVTTTSLEAFKDSFKTRVLDSLQRAGATIYSEKDVGVNFERAMRELSQKHGCGVVVLVDEYDAPIGHALHDVELAEAIRAEMANFYIQLKANIECVRFLMMTGVSKFSQVSVFSALNNITDLTLDARAATMLGYTEEELERYFREPMEAHAKVMGLDYDTYREQLRFWYNGYHFARYRLAPQYAVYNPYAISRTLSQQEPYFSATWTSTGQPSMLANYLKREELVKRDYENVTVMNEGRMAATNLRNLSGTALLFQAGYLTIKDYDPDEGYTLGVPDEEVRRSLLLLLTQCIAQKVDDEAWVDDTLKALYSRDFGGFFNHLTALYADLPYGSTEKGSVPEASYLRLLYMLLRSRFSTLQVCYERSQTAARPDLVFVHRKSVFIFELKVRREKPITDEDALAQIKEKDYAAALRSHNLPIYGIGLLFDNATHTLIDYAAEEL